MVASLNGLNKPSAKKRHESSGQDYQIFPSSSWLGSVAALHDLQRSLLAAKKTSGDPSWPPVQHSTACWKEAPLKNIMRRQSLKSALSSGTQKDFCRTDSWLCYPDLTWDSPEQPFQALYNHLHHLLWYYLFIILFRHWKIRGMLMLSLLEALKMIKENGN